MFLAGTLPSFGMPLPMASTRFTLRHHLSGMPLKLLSTVNYFSSLGVCICNIILFNFHIFSVIFQVSTKSNWLNKIHLFCQIFCQKKILIHKNLCHKTKPLKIFPLLLFCMLRNRCNSEEKKFIFTIPISHANSLCENVCLLKK